MQSFGKAAGATGLGIGMKHDHFGVFCKSQHIILSNWCLLTNWCRFTSCVEIWTKLTVNHPKVVVFLTFTGQAGINATRRIPTRTWVLLSGTKNPL